MRSLALTLTVLLGLATTVPLAAADEMPEPGTRIRLSARTPGHEHWIGPFVSLARDTVTMRAGDTTGAFVTVHRLSVTKFEISRGERSNSLRNACVGFVIGALAGAAIGYYAGESSDFGPGAVSLVGAVSVGALGAAIGAGHGALAPSEHWRKLPLNDLHPAPIP